MSGGCKDSGSNFWRTQGSAPAASDMQSWRRPGSRCCCASALEGERERCPAMRSGGQEGVKPTGSSRRQSLHPCRASIKKPRVWVWDREAACPAATPGGRQRETAQGTELGAFLPLALPAGPATPRCSPSTSPPPCPTGDRRPRPLPGSSGATGASASRGTGRERSTGRGAAHSQEGQAGLGVLSVCLSVCLSPAALAPYKVTARAV